MKSGIIQPLLLGVFLIIGSSCDNDRERPMEPKVIDRTDHVEVNTVETEKELESFRLDAESRIDENERKIKEIEDRKLEDRKQNKEEYSQRIADLKERNNKLRTRVKEYRKESGQKWEEFKKEFNHDMDELGKALNDFTIDNKK